MRARTLVLLLLIAAAAVAVPPLSASPEDASTMVLTFAEQRPGVATELQLGIVYRDPSDPEGKPSPIRDLEIAAPEGTVFDTSAVPACAATDEEIRLLGPGACPPESQIGSGSLTAVTGVPAVDPAATDAFIFNGGTELIEVFTPQGLPAPVLAIDRIAISEHRLVGHPPATPGGPPDGQTAVRTIDFVFPADTGFVITPATCPLDGAWRSTGRFTFADGTTQTTRGTTRCAPAPVE